MDLDQEELRERYKKEMENDRVFVKNANNVLSTSVIAKDFIPPDKIISKNKIHALKGQQRAKEEENRKNKEDIMKKMQE